MSSNSPSLIEVIEAFLLIEQPRQRIGHWAAALASLDSPLAPTPIGVIAFYDPSSDQALLNLQYDAAAVGDHKLDFVVQVALLAEVGMVQPAELSEGERGRFLSARLSRCTIRVTSQTTAVGALTQLSREIRDAQSARLHVAPPPPPAIGKPRPKVPMPARDKAASPSARNAPAVIIPESKSAPVHVAMPAPRGVIDDPLVTAKGTRDNLERLRSTADHEVDRYVDSDLIPEIDIDDVVDGSAEPLLDAPRSTPHLVPRSSRFSTVEMSPEVRDRLVAERAASEFDDDRLTSPIDLAKLQELAGHDELTTSPMSLDQLQSLVAQEEARRPPPLRPPTENDFADEDDVRPVTMPAMPNLIKLRASSPDAAAATESDPPSLRTPSTIYARYLRGGRWVAVRVGALSLHGAALLAGALPRVDDRVDVALSFGSHRALVRGVVAKVSTQREAATSGTATFSVTWLSDTVAKRQLTALLVAARDAKITIKPPPPRSTRRFPVEWHIALGTKRGATKCVALDVSTGGMFVRSPYALELGLVASFSVILDDGGSPIAGRAQVVRKVTEAEARACGLAAGFGLVIIEMSESNRMRWLGFLARIERRAEKRVLIGADPARLAELQAGLASLGYAVVGGTDPGTLVQLANTDRPADAVLIDAGWLQNESSTSLVESLFSARNVPCVTMHGEARRARQAIDRLLEVVV